MPGCPQERADGPASKRARRHEVPTPAAAYCASGAFAGSRSWLLWLGGDKRNTKLADQKFGLLLRHPLSLGTTLRDHIQCNQRTFKRRQELLDFIDSGIMHDTMVHGLRLAVVAFLGHPRIGFGILSDDLLRLVIEAVMDTCDSQPAPDVGVSMAIAFPLRQPDLESLCFGSSLGARVKSLEIEP
jgi:hypothetical protein